MERFCSFFSSFFIVKKGSEECARSLRTHRFEPSNKVRNKQKIKSLVQKFLKIHNERLILVSMFPLCLRLFVEKIDARNFKAATP